MDQMLKKYYLFVKNKPCLACQKPSTLREPSEADHIKPWVDKLKTFGARSHKGISAYFCVPLCRECHKKRHQAAEEEWYEAHGWPKEALYAYLAYQLAEFLSESDT